MQKRTLGRTGIEVSEIAFGGVEIGLPYANNLKPSAGESFSLLRNALSRGINFFDTARMYGDSETLIGKAFAKERTRVIISTKCRHLSDNNGSLPDHQTLEQIMVRSLTESLNALETDYIDVFMLHQVSPEIFRNETILNRFVKIREEGKARAIGISTNTFTETLQGIESGIWDVIQLPFNLLDQQQRICFELAGKAGIGIVARSVLFRGMLSGNSLNLHPALKEVQNHIKRYEKMLIKSWSTLPTLATKFVLSYQDISSVLIGIDKMDYLHDAIEAADGNYPQGEVLSRFESMQFPNHEFLNIHQWVKNGWLI